MTDLFFRAIVPDEVDDFFASLAIAFSDPRPDAEEVETDKKVIEVDRTFAAFDGDRIVGCAGVYSQRMVVAGGARGAPPGVAMGGGLPPPPPPGGPPALMGVVLPPAAAGGGPVAALCAPPGARH